jgi:hypothetical protein
MICTALQVSAFVRDAKVNSGISSVSQQKLVFTYLCARVPSGWSMVGDRARELEQSLTACGGASIVGYASRLGGRLLTGAECPPGAS